jgi:hypothetical protein
MRIGPPPAFSRFASDVYRARLVMLREKVAPILANNLLPHFTDHTVTHSDQVTELVDKLLEDAKPNLSDPELLILYSACYLHDVGMQYEQAGQTQTIKGLNLDPAWDRQSEVARRDLLRRFHHCISAEMVGASAGAANPPIGFQLTSDFNAPYIAQLCHAHAIPTDTDDYRSLVEDGPGIRMGLMSALLRLADILDESRRRALPERARTLLLDIDSQKHWWRHYYTEGVILDPARHEVTIWFDFPKNRLTEYKKIIPALQMPWIQEEFQRHASVLFANGCQWTVRQQMSAKPYSDVEAMPESVLMAMVNELTHRNRARDEELRLAALTQLKEARPSFQRRLALLKEQEEMLAAGAYLLELSNIAFDLFGLGGRRAARSLLHNRFSNDYQQLAFDDRVRIGLCLLEWQIDADNDHEAVQLLDKLGPEFEALQSSDERKVAFTRLRIKVLDMQCAYDETKAVILKSIETATSLERTAMEADLAEMRLLHGDFPSKEG